MDDSEIATEIHRMLSKNSQSGSESSSLALAAWRSASAAQRGARDARPTILRRREDSDSCPTYGRNILGAAALQPRKIRGVDVAKLGAVDVLLFGCPCNDFSMIGEARGLDCRYAPLYRHAVRFIDAKVPSVSIAENVLRLTHSVEDAQPPIGSVVSALRALGLAGRLTIQKRALKK